MRRYFAREPRYSRQEIERQAQEAIDARVALGRPPAEDFLPLEQRLAELDRAPVAEPQPMEIRQVHVPPASVPAPAPDRKETARRQPVAARQSAN
ncbi:MAG: hypothetical protein M3326_03640 [Actinomycetota bacterium]|nr:hypothetical protein [Actinomycetota bacterium]